MIRQLLEEVKAAPLDEASRNRLKEIHAASIKELETGPGARAGRGARAAVAALHRGRHARPRASCGSPRPSWSAGSRASSTASRPRSTPSRWPRAPSSSRCAARCPPGAARPAAVRAAAPSQGPAERRATPAACTSDAGRPTPERCSAQRAAGARPVGRATRPSRPRQRRQQPSTPTISGAAPGQRSGDVGGRVDDGRERGGLGRGARVDRRVPVAEQLLDLRDVRRGRPAPVPPQPVGGAGVAVGAAAKKTYVVPTSQLPAGRRRRGRVSVDDLRPWLGRRAPW